MDGSGTNPAGGGCGRIVLGGKMQAEYKKEWMETYLWILPENRKPDSYEEKMVLYNPGEGRLEFSIREQEGTEYFCYKVTGKKSLNSVYAVMPIGERQIRAILKQLFSALEKGKEFLLSEDDFVLLPNYIFASFPQMNLELCYVPGYGVPLREQLEGLFEYLLNRVDYDDKGAVNFLYDCYMFCMREKGGLQEIKKLLAQEKEEQGKEEVPSQEELPAMPASSIAVSYPKEEHLAEKSGGNSYVTWLTEKLFPWKRREPALIAEEKAEYRAGKTTEYGQEEERTVLLSTPKKPPCPELICEKTGEVVYLNKFPFYIGSAKEYADFVPAAEGVSRIHCCVSKKESNYYLSDLNSTNGTYLNGKEIIPGKEALLSANDEIRITSQKFYMNFPCL